MTASACTNPYPVESKMGEPNTVVKKVSAEQVAREELLTSYVLKSFEDAPSPRLKQIMQALVRHLHAFVRETRLTTPEWDKGIEFLTQVGQICDDKRQEFILLSDVLGVSMQTVAVNNEGYKNATAATVFGPFFVTGSPEIPQCGDSAFGAKGQPCWVEGTVTDTDGNRILGAKTEVWEADEDGFYDVQYESQQNAARADIFSDDNGEYRFWCLTPSPYPIPNDGSVGKMLDATGRSPMRASHLHFMVTADGKHTLVTHIFVNGCEYLKRDTVFGVKPSLIKDFETQSAGTPTPAGRELDRDWAKVRFDIVLAPARDEHDEDLHYVALDEGQPRRVE